MSQSTLAVTAAEEQATVSVTAPASKSVSHRSLIVAALAQGVSTVRPTRFNESDWHVQREAGIACVRMANGRFGCTAPGRRRARPRVYVIK